MKLFRTVSDTNGNFGKKRNFPTHWGSSSEFLLTPFARKELEYMTLSDVKTVVGMCIRLDTIP